MDSIRHRTIVGLIVVLSIASIASSWHVHPTAIVVPKGHRLSIKVSLTGSNGCSACVLAQQHARFPIVTAVVEAPHRVVSSVRTIRSLRLGPSKHSPDASRAPPRTSPA